MKQLFMSPECVLDLLIKVVLMHMATLPLENV